MDGSPGEMKYPDARPFTYEDGRAYEEFVVAKTS